jgi:hypothetical protein
MRQLCYKYLCSQALNIVSIRNLTPTVWVHIMRKPIWVRSCSYFWNLTNKNRRCPKSYRPWNVVGNSHGSTALRGDRQKTLFLGRMMLMLRILNQIFPQISVAALYQKRKMLFVSNIALPAPSELWNYHSSNAKSKSKT